LVEHTIHDHEPDTSEAIVRMLLAAECPKWSGAPVAYLKTSGTDNAMWRVRVNAEHDVVVRLPRHARSAEKVLRETALLGMLSDAFTSAICTPRVLHVGEPHEAFPHRWSVLGWLDGSDAWSARAELDANMEQLAVDLGEAVLAVRELSRLPAVERRPGDRGGPIEPLVRRLEGWLCDPRWRASDLIDVARVRSLATEALDVADAFETRFVHGDLIPGNLLVRSGRLSAIIDWGSAGYGDSAQDLSPAWSVLSSRARRVFRAVVEADDASWIRARTFELEHAVGGILYYVPRGHVLGDVMARTLERILDEDDR